MTKTFIVDYVESESLAFRDKVRASLFPADGSGPDFESAIEAVIFHWGKETTFTRDDAVDVVEYIFAEGRLT